MFRRRASHAANDFFRSIFGRFRKNASRRSFSTGDLADNYVEMDFTQPTTSSLPAHFDDCDLVPMNFIPSSSPRLLPQYDRRAQRLLRYGSEMDYSMVSVADYNRAQIWFHHGLNSVRAERLLRGAGCEEGSFVISEQSGRYVLSFVYSASIHHMRIGYSVKNGEAKFCLDIDRSFSNLHNLVEYYTKHKSFVLPTKLKRGVPRPLRVTHARTRA